MSDAYSWWRRSLAGERVGCFEDEPEAGFYRIQVRRGEWLPVAVFESADGIMAMLGGSPAEPLKVWPRCGRHPITESVYRAVAEQDKPWPKNPREEYPDEQCHAA